MNTKNKESENLLKYKSSKYSINRLTKNFQLEIEHVKKNGVLAHLLKAKGLFSELLRSNMLTHEDLKFLINVLDGESLDAFDRHDYLMKYCIENDVVTFKELINLYKHTQDLRNDDASSFLYRLVSNVSAIEFYTKNKLLKKEDIECLLNALSDSNELWFLCNWNTSLLNYIIQSHEVSFRTLVDKFKSIKSSDDSQSSLSYLIFDSERYQMLFESKSIDSSDVQYVLDSLDCINDIESLCRNTSLLKYALSNCLLTKNHVNAYNSILTNFKQLQNGYDASDIFSLLKKRLRNIVDEDLMRLVSIHEKLNALSFSQQDSDKLFTLLSSNEIAKNSFEYVFENQLEHTFDNFEELLKYLKKEMKKTSLNI